MYASRRLAGLAILHRLTGDQCGCISAVPLDRASRDIELHRCLGDAGFVLLPPRPHSARVSSEVPPELGFATVRLARAFQRLPSRPAAIVTSLCDPVPLHVGHLSQHGDNQFPDTPANRAKPVDIHCHTLVEQSAHRGLYVECVAAKPVNGIYAQLVALSDVLQQRREAGAVGC